jgi:Zn-dependent protease with chaperone function
VHALVLTLLLAGCAATGPKITSQELIQAREWLKARAVFYQHEQLRRVNVIGYRLIGTIAEDPLKEAAGELEPPHPYPFVGSPSATDTPSPEQIGPARSPARMGPARSPYPFAGWLVTPLKKDAERAYGLPAGMKGALIAGVIPNSPAESAGLSAGDVLTRLNDQPIASLRQLAAAMKRLAPGDRVEVAYQRSHEARTTAFSVDAVPQNIVFHMTEDEDVNAFAAGGGLITVTYGMMRFVHSDDELAVVLGHELAHVTRHHVAKNMGSSMVAGLFGGALGGTIDVFVPGLGTALGSRVSQAIQAQFSKDWEREADFVGLTYVDHAGFDVQAGWRIWERFSIEVPGTFAGPLLSTHPTSPERMIRLQKTAYALVHHLPLDTIETADIPLELDPLQPFPDPPTPR